MIPLPPMSPILSETIPTGDDWGYQLKWDGVRMIASVATDEIKLFSKHGRAKELVYPDVVRTLAAQRFDAILDGEMIVFDPELKRPHFQKILTLEKQRGRLHSPPYAATYVVFDLLALNGTDLRDVALAQRHELLNELLTGLDTNVIVSELYTDGNQLWQWVIEHEWEGIVSKRLSSAYQLGKQHADWYKKKKKFEAVVEIIGIVTGKGMPKSLVMRHQGRYIGKVSLGLTTDDRRQLLEFIQSNEHVTSDPPFPLPEDLKRDAIVWLKHPFKCEVTALEFTSVGVLRHPKIVGFRA